MIVIDEYKEERFRTLRARAKRLAKYQAEFEKSPNWNHIPLSHRWRKAQQLRERIFYKMGVLVSIYSREVS